MSTQLTSNGLLLRTDPDPAGSGMRMRTLANPQTNQIIPQFQGGQYVDSKVIGPKSLKTKAVRRLRRAR